MQLWHLQEDRGIAPEPVADLAITWGAASVLLKWSVTSDEDNGTPDRYDIYVKTQSFDDMDLSGIEPTKSIDVSRMKLGDEVSVRDTRFDSGDSLLCCGCRCGSFRESFGLYGRGR